MTSILALDVAGNPFRWLTPERAAYYQAANKVAWEIGEKVLVLRGGVNRHTGERSILEVAPVIALAKSEGMAKWAQVALPLGHRNDLLFARDRHILEIRRATRTPSATLSPVIWYWFRKRRTW